MDFENMSLERFTKVLASTEATPGGGGAAALVGALSAALCSMAGGISLKNKKYADKSAEIIPALSRCEELRKRLLYLANEDARLFAPLMQAYSVPKDDPDRERILEAATLDACAAPAEMLRCCCELSELLCGLSGNCSPMLISDIGCAAMCCHAAAECAAMNVFVNTRSLKDRKKAHSIEAETRALLSECSAPMLELGGKIADELGRRG